MIPKKTRLKDRALLDQYHQLRCVICNTLGCDPAHIKTKGSGGHDAHWNIMPLCRLHHVEQHKLGWAKLGMKYQMIFVALSNRGWVFDENNKVKRKS